jgi:hypothetical protein
MSSKEKKKKTKSTIKFFERESQKIFKTRNIKSNILQKNSKQIFAKKNQN